jgi:hypothetical protein
MEIPILIEPLADGRFRARAGEPFAVTAEADSSDEALQHLEAMLRDRLQGGSRLAAVNLDNGPPQLQPPLSLEPLPDDDWFFRTLRESIAEHRRSEDEAGE